MKYIYFILIQLLLSYSIKAQYYLHQTEYDIRSTVPYDIHDFYDKTGYKVLYWNDDRQHCRQLSYISNVSKTVISTILMVKEEYVEEWVNKFNTYYVAIARDRWTNSNNSLYIKMSYDGDNHGWQFFITDNSGIENFRKGN